MTFRTRNVLFVAYVATLVFAFARPLQDLFQLSRSNETASHVLLIPFVTLALIYQSRTSIFASTHSSWRLGVATIVLGTSVAVVAGARTGVTEVDALLGWRVAGFVMLCGGGFLTCYGIAATKAALFPLLFLAFMIPVPHVVLEWATFRLRTASSDLVAALFSLTGTPYHRQGFVFALPGVAIEIADACSGIRSSIALVLTALLAGHMFLSKSWTKLVLVLVVLPMAVLKNAIRIVGLSLLALHVDPGFLAGRLHHEGGIVFFVAALLLVTPVFLFLRWVDSSRPAARVVHTQLASRSHS